MPASSSPVVMKPAEMNSVASVAISTIGIFFGKYGVFDTTAREMMRASRRHRAEAVARGRLAILGEIGFEQVALRLGFALQRAQLHVLLVGRRRLPLELVETARSCSTRAPAMLRVVLERTREPLRLVADLAVEIGDLRLQFLDARMVVEQRGRLLGELRAQA